MSTDDGRSRDPWWLESLERALKYTDDRADGPLTLLELADELELWAQDARPPAWQRNRGLLQEELNATVAEASGWADDVTLALIGETVEAIDRHTRLDVVARESILNEVARIRAHLLSDSAIRAQGARLIEAARDETVTYGQMVQSRELLDDQLRGLGRDSHYALLDAVWEIRGTRHDKSDVAPIGERIENGLSSLVQAREAVDVVVWLVYDDADIGNRVVSSGPLTLFSARWALANVKAETSREFPFRAELEAFASHPGSWLDEPDEYEQKVIARVGLGHRQTYGAYEAAASIVSAFVDTAVNRVSGVDWTPFGLAHLQIDGDLMMGGSHRFGAFDFDERRRESIHETGWEVAKWVERLGPRLAVDNLPSDPPRSSRTVDPKIEFLGLTERYCPVGC